MRCAVAEHGVLQIPETFFIDSHFFVANESCISFFGGKQNVQTKPAMIWRFPEIVVPPNHPFYCNGIFHCKASSYWGTP